MDNNPNIKLELNEHLIRKIVREVFSQFRDELKALVVENNIIVTDHNGRGPERKEWWRDWEL